MFKWGHSNEGAPDYTRMDKPDVTLNTYRIGGHTHFETMDMEQTYKLRSEKCLISLAKACGLKRFCYDPDSKNDLVPIIVGKNKIEGGKCPKLQENIDSFNVTDGNQWGPCNHGYECSYCEEGASKVSKYVISFFNLWRRCKKWDKKSLEKKKLTDYTYFMAIPVMDF